MLKWIERVIESGMNPDAALLPLGNQYLTLNQFKKSILYDDPAVLQLADATFNVAMNMTMNLMVQGMINPGAGSIGFNPLPLQQPHPQYQQPQPAYQSPPPPAYEPPIPLTIDSPQPQAETPVEAAVQPAAPEIPQPSPEPPTAQTAPEPVKAAAPPAAPAPEKARPTPANKGQVVNWMRNLRWLKQYLEGSSIRQIRETTNLSDFGVVYAIITTASRLSEQNGIKADYKSAITRVLAQKQALLPLVLDALGEPQTANLPAPPTSPESGTPRTEPAPGQPEPTPAPQPIKAEATGALSASEELLLRNLPRLIYFLDLDTPTVAAVATQFREMSGPAVSSQITSAANQVSRRYNLGLHFTKATEVPHNRSKVLEPARRFLEHLEARQAQHPKQPLEAPATNRINVVPVDVTTIDKRKVIKAMVISSMSVLPVSKAFGISPAYLNPTLVAFMKHLKGLYPQLLGEIPYPERNLKFQSLNDYADNFIQLLRQLEAEAGEISPYLTGRSVSQPTAVTPTEVAPKEVAPTEPAVPARTVNPKANPIQFHSPTDSAKPAAPGRVIDMPIAPAATRKPATKLKKVQPDQVENVLGDLKKKLELEKDQELRTKPIFERLPDSEIPHIEDEEEDDDRTTLVVTPSGVKLSEIKDPHKKGFLFGYKGAIVALTGDREVDMEKFRKTRTKHG